MANERDLAKEKEHDVAVKWPAAANTDRLVFISQQSERYTDNKEWKLQSSITCLPGSNQNAFSTLKAIGNEMLSCSARPFGSQKRYEEIYIELVCLRKTRGFTLLLLLL